METIEEETNAIQAMLDSPGWQLFAQHAEAFRASAYQAMIAANDGAVMAKHMGTFRAAEELLKWPLYKLQANHHEMSQMKTQTDGEAPNFWDRRRR